MMRPVLYSFRRCPYAMRARLAIASSGPTVQLREIVLRDKAPEFLALSPKGTVPVLHADTVIEESLDIMHWALNQSDPEHLMAHQAPDLIAECDGPFKTALDLTKYAVRHPEVDPVESRATASAFIHRLDTQLTQNWLFGDAPSIADLAILPFIRQFAHTDLEWWISQPYPNAQRWLEGFKTSQRFANIMTKYPPWKSGQDIVLFP